MVYTCKFGFVLRLFFPKVSSNEVNLFFILPSFDNGFIKTQKEELVNEVLAEIENQLGATNRSEINHHFESERILSWKEVEQLAQIGATIGSHSVDHCILR